MIINCPYCGKEMHPVLIRDGYPGGNGFDEILPEYDWDHSFPTDCIGIINGKIDRILSILIPEEN